VFRWKPGSDARSVSGGGARRGGGGRAPGPFHWHQPNTRAPCFRLCESIRDKFKLLCWTVLTHSLHHCRYKKTIICQEVAKAKNVCQVCHLPSLS